MGVQIEIHAAGRKRAREGALRTRESSIWGVTTRASGQRAGAHHAEADIPAEDLREAAHHRPNIETVDARHAPGGCFEDRYSLCSQKMSGEDGTVISGDHKNHRAPSTGMPDLCACRCNRPARAPDPQAGLATERRNPLVRPAD